MPSAECRVPSASAECRTSGTSNRCPENIRLSTTHRSQTVAIVQRMMRDGGGGGDGGGGDDGMPQRQPARHNNRPFVRLAHHSPHSAFYVYFIARRYHPQRTHSQTTHSPWLKIVKMYTVPMTRQRSRCLQQRLWDIAARHSVSLSVQFSRPGGATRDDGRWLFRRSTIGYSLLERSAPETGVRDSV